MEAAQTAITETEQIVMSFSNGLGNKYTWNIQRGNEKANLTAAAELQRKIAGIEITKPDDQEATWGVKSAPHYRQPRAQRTTTKNKPTTTVIHELFETDPEPEPEATSTTTEASKQVQRNWLFTPANVELWHHETLVKHLKNFYQETHDADTFLAYLRMLLVIYRCEFLDLNKTVAAGDFYNEVWDIYNLNQQWSCQMMAALPEIGFMFSRFELTSLKERLATQKRLQSKAALAKTEAVALIVEAPTTLSPDGDELPVAQESPEKVKKKGLTKKEKALLKNFQNKGKNTKKKRGLFF